MFGCDDLGMNGGDVTCTVESADEFFVVALCDVKFALLLVAECFSHLFVHIF